MRNAVVQKQPSSSGSKIKLLMAAIQSIVSERFEKQMSKNESQKTVQNISASFQKSIHGGGKEKHSQLQKRLLSPKSRS